MWFMYFLAPVTKPLFLCGQKRFVKTPLQSIITPLLQSEAVSSCKGCKQAFCEHSGTKGLATQWMTICDGMVARVAEILHQRCPSEKSASLRLHNNPTTYNRGSIIQPCQALPKLTALVPALSREITLMPQYLQRAILLKLLFSLELQLFSQGQQP